MKLNLREYREITKITVIIASLTLFAGIFVLIFGLTNNNNEKTYDYVLVFISLLLIVTSIYYITRPLLIKKALNIRDKQFLESASLLKLEDNYPKINSSLLDIGKENKMVKVRNSYKGDGFEVFDYVIDEYDGSQESKDNYKKTICFFVFSIRLPRELPNVFFDSKSTGKREFSKVFTSEQKHSLEGNFDDYFTTYFANDYTIDSLSFITPEVMHAIIEAEQYDVEIFKDKLFLYNELETMPNQLSDAKAKAELIRTKLLNNIKTYRDERLPYEQGRKLVHINGIRLRRRVFWSYIKLILSALVLFYGIIYLFKGDDWIVGLFIVLFPIPIININYNKIVNERYH